MVQLMLSKFEYDGELNPNFRVGDFALPLSSIYGVNTAKASSPRAAKFVHISSAGVTRVNRPGLDLEKVWTLLEATQISVHYLFQRFGHARVLACCLCTSIASACRATNFAVCECSFLRFDTPATPQLYLWKSA